VNTPVTGSIPVFPLQQPLMPQMLLSLNVFEPRYVKMLKDILSERFGRELRFGVVMIARGSEVGGGEDRTTVGCMARVLSMEPPLPTAPEDLGEDRDRAGPVHLQAVGTWRFRVNSWLPDDPYPAAEVTAFPADEGDPVALEPVRTAYQTLSDLWEEKQIKLPRLSDHGGPSELSAAECSAALWEVALGSPIGSFDRYQLLGAPTLADRATLLLDALETQIAVATMA
jgi:Lon protease-like protein